MRLNRELVAANPADVGSRNRLASCLRLAGQLDDAEAEYAEVLRREGGNRIARNGLEAIARQRRLDGMTPDELLREPPPDRFVGFRRREFIELEFCPDADTT